MAYVKLALAAIFLATIFICPMKKVEACDASWCALWDLGVCGSDCGCYAWGFLGGNCISKSELKRKVEENPNLCESHMDCIKKKSGSFCGSYPNSEIQHGWCFTSNVEAERYFEVLSNPTISNFLNTVTKSNGKGFFKIAT